MSVEEGSASLTVTSDVPFARLSLITSDYREVPGAAVGHGRWTGLVPGIYKLRALVGSRAHDEVIELEAGENEHAVPPAWVESVFPSWGRPFDPIEVAQVTEVAGAPPPQGASRLFLIERISSRPGRRDAERFPEDEVTARLDDKTWRRPAFAASWPTLRGNRWEGHARTAELLFPAEGERLRISLPLAHDFPTQVHVPVVDGQRRLSDLVVLMHAAPSKLDPIRDTYWPRLALALVRVLADDAPIATAELAGEGLLEKETDPWIALMAAHALLATARPHGDKGRPDGSDGFVSDWLPRAPGLVDRLAQQLPESADVLALRAGLVLLGVQDASGMPPTLTGFPALASSWSWLVRYAQAVDEGFIPEESAPGRKAHLAFRMGAWLARHDRPAEDSADDWKESFRMAQAEESGPDQAEPASVPLAERARLEEHQSVILAVEEGSRARKRKPTWESVRPSAWELLDGARDDVGLREVRDHAVLREAREPGEFLEARAARALPEARELEGVGAPRAEEGRGGDDLGEAPRGGVGDEEWIRRMARNAGLPPATVRRLLK